MPRFYVDGACAPDSVPLPTKHAHHAVHVLRVLPATRSAVQRTGAIRARIASIQRLTVLVTCSRTARWSASRAAPWCS